LEKTFDTLLKTRKRLQEILQNTSKEDLCKIPDGFKNNIWWNIAHVVVTQQILVYKLSGAAVLINEEWINTYKKGTFPEKEPTETEISYISGALISCIEKTKEDFDKGHFKTFNTYTTSLNVNLRSASDALIFNVLHEGLHLGTILALRKAIKA